MALTNTTLSNFFNTNRTEEKWVMGQSKELVSVPAGQIAIEFDPSTGKKLGILVEGPSTNHVEDSETLSSPNFELNKVIREETSIAGSSHSFRFDGIGGVIYNSDTMDASEFFGVTFFIKMEDGSKPSIGHSFSRDCDFYMTHDGYHTEFLLDGSYTAFEGPLADGSYRFRGVLRATTKEATNIGIHVSSKQRKVPFNISRIQIENNTVTSYIPTYGTIQTRDGETVSHTLTPGQEFNNNQGTFDLVFRAAPNTSGAVMTIRDDDWSDVISVGLFQTPSFDKSPIVYQSIDNIEDLYFNDLKLNEGMGTKNTIRFSYSGYGVRYSLNSNNVSYLKDYNSFKNTVPTIMQFGESTEGTHFNGHIAMVRYYGRTMTSSEMTEFFDGGEIEYEFHNVSMFTETNKHYLTTDNILSQCLIFVQTESNVCGLNQCAPLSNKSIGIRPTSGIVKFEEVTASIQSITTNQNSGVNIYVDGAASGTLTISNSMNIMNEPLTIDEENQYIGGIKVYGECGNTDYSSDTIDGSPTIDGVISILLEGRGIQEAVTINFSLSRISPDLDVYQSPIVKETQKSFYDVNTYAIHVQEDVMFGEKDTVYYMKRTFDFSGYDEVIISTTHDGEGFIYLNGVKIYQKDANDSSIPTPVRTSVVNGSNNITLGYKNIDTGTPAYMIFQIKDVNGNVIYRSNESGWVGAKTSTGIGDDA